MNMNQDYHLTALAQPAGGWANPRAAQLTEQVILDGVQSQLSLPPGVKLTVEAATDLGPGLFRIAHDYRAEVEGEHVAKAEALDAALRQIGLLGVNFVVDHVIDYTLQYAVAGGGGGLVAGSKNQNLAPVLAIGGMVLGGLLGHATRRVEPVYRLQRDRWGKWQIWELGDASGSPELS
jgi:hypothetical protein